MSGLACGLIVIVPLARSRLLGGLIQFVLAELDRPAGACLGHFSSRSRSRTQKPWCAHSSFSTTCTHSSTDLPLAYGGQPRPAGTGAGADSSSGVTADSQRSS